MHWMLQHLGRMWYNGIVQISNADRVKGTVATGVKRGTSSGEKKREAVQSSCSDSRRGISVLSPWDGPKN